MLQNTTYPHLDSRGKTTFRCHLEVVIWTFYLREKGSLLDILFTLQTVALKGFNNEFTLKCHPIIMGLLIGWAAKSIIQLRWKSKSQERLELDDMQIPVVSVRALFGFGRFFLLQKAHSAVQYIT